MPCCACKDDLEGLAITYHKFITFFDFQCSILLFTRRFYQRETGDAVKKPLHVRRQPRPTHWSQALNPSTPDSDPCQWKSCTIGRSLTDHKVNSFFFSDSVK